MAEPDDPRSGADWSWSELAGSHDSGPPCVVVPASAEPPRYEPGPELGRGGMGTVVATLDTHLGRRVARKQLREGADAARLVREARITASLEHPGIVPVYDAGVDDQGRPWYTMRVASGRTLADAIAESPDAAARLRLVRPLLAACEAVSYAHSRGVVHRDLKPANILVGAHGETQVADWGLAARLDEPPAASAALVGTPGWMSPEQARGEPPNPRADVWSLGAVLVALLAGRPRFAGLASDAVLARLRAGDLPDVDVPGAPPELLAVARVAMAPRAADRYPDAGALAEELARWLEGRRVEAHVYTTGELASRLLRRWRVPLFVGAVATVALVGVGASAWTRTRAERARALEAEAATAAALQTSDTHLSQALLSQGRAALHVGAMPEAALLAAHALELGHDVTEARGLLSGALAAGAATRTQHDELPACDRATLSEDGEALVCVDAGGLSVLHGHPLSVRWRVDGTAGRVEARGGVIYAVRGETVTVYDIAQGTVLGSVDDVAESWSLDVAPDGSHAWAVAGMAPTLRITPGAPASRAWPCGQAGASAHASVGAHAALACDDGDVVVDGVRRGTELVRSAGKAAIFAYAPDASLLAAGTYQGEILLLDPASGATLRRFVPDGSAIQDLAFSPDGARLALATERGGVSVWRVRTGARVVQLPRTGVRKIRFAAPDELVTLGSELARWRLPRSSEPWLYARAPGVSTIAVSPDGEQLAAAYGDGAVAVWGVKDGDERELRWQDRVAKDVAFVGEVVVGAGMGAPPAHGFDRRSGEDRGEWRPLELQPYRRVDALGGTLFAIPFGGAGPYLWEHGRDAEPVDLALGAAWDAAGTPPGDAVVVAGERGVYRLRRGAAPERVSADPAVRAVDAGPGGEVALAFPDHVEVGLPGALRATAHVDDVLLDVALSPDGGLVAGAGLSGVAWLWSAEDGVLLASLRGHEGRVSAVDFSLDGRALFSGSWDGRIRRWDLAAIRQSATGVADAHSARSGLTLDGVLDADFR